MIRLAPKTETISWAKRKSVSGGKAKGFNRAGRRGASTASTRLTAVVVVTVPCSRWPLSRHHHEVPDHRVGQQPRFVGRQAELLGLLVCQLADARQLRLVERRWRCCGAALARGERLQRLEQTLNGRRDRVRALRLELLGQLRREETHHLRRHRQDHGREECDGAADAEPEHVSVPHLPVLRLARTLEVRLTRRAEEHQLVRSYLRHLAARQRLDERPLFGCVQAHVRGHWVTASGCITTSTQLTSPVAGSYSPMPAENFWRTTARPSGAVAGYSSLVAGPRVSPRR